MDGEQRDDGGYRSSIACNPREFILTNSGLNKHIDSNYRDKLFGDENGDNNQPTHFHLKELIQLAAFLKRNLKAFRWMEREQLIRFLMWHTVRKHIVVKYENEKLVGVTIARGVDSLYAAQDHYHYNDESSLVLCGYMVSKRKGLLKAMIQTFKKYRFPECEKICFSRKEKGRGTLKIYDLNRFIEVCRG